MKNNSARKKLIPAAAMLAVSAAMLATSTYAWFTMSKVVEVTGIDMTATTPASIQLSLGKGQGNGALVYSTSFSPENITVPDNTVDSPDWSNTVVFSDFYKVGNLIPASSTTGNSLFYTDDATAVGKTISDKALFTQVTSAKRADELVSGSADSAKEGYYVDFPVWFRSSNTSAVDLGVYAQISYKTGNSYVIQNAARVAILDSDSSGTGSGSDGIIMVADDTTNHNNLQLFAKKNDNDTNAYGRYYNRYGTYETAAANAGADLAVKAAKDTDAKITDENYTTYYDAVDRLKLLTKSAAEYSGGEAVVELAAKGNDAYCTPVKKIVRVWLEGEDVNCWNATEGQDFTISLTFAEVTT